MIEIPAGVALVDPVVAIGAYAKALVPEQEGGCPAIDLEKALQPGDGLFERLARAAVQVGGMDTRHGTQSEVVARPVCRSKASRASLLLPPMCQS